MTKYQPRLLFQGINTAQCNERDIRMITLERNVYARASDVMVIVSGERQDRNESTNTVRWGKRKGNVQKATACSQHLTPNQAFFFFIILLLGARKTASAALGEVLGGSRVVLHDGLDAHDDLRSDLLDHVQGAEGLLELRGVASAHDGGRDVLVAQAPGEGELALGAAEVLGDVAELLDAGKDTLPGLLGRHTGEVEIREPLHALDREARVLGKVVAGSAVVLAGQNTAGKRGPDGAAELLLLEETLVLDLEALAVEERVLALLHDRANQAQTLSGVLGNLNVLGAPLGGAPVEGLALVDDPVHRANGLLDGGMDVGAVAVNDVDVVELETLQAGSKTLNNVLAGAALVVGLEVLAVVAAPEDLGGDDNVRARYVELPQDLAEADLGLTILVYKYGSKCKSIMHGGAGGERGLICMMAIYVRRYS